jgi:hypothetical protein
MLMRLKRTAPITAAAMATTTLTAMVDSHIRHIYAKMDIHSKGELLQLLDELES